MDATGKDEVRQPCSANRELRHKAEWGGEGGGTTWETQIVGGLADVLFMGPKQAHKLFPALEYG